MKKNRSYGYNDLYYSTLRQRGCRSDTEDDEDEFASIRKKLRMKLSGSSTSTINNNTENDTTDNSSANVCERCKGGLPSPQSNDYGKLPKNRGSQTKIRGVDDPLWKDDTKKEPHAKEPQEFSSRRKVTTRSIGVGMMRSFTKESGVGSGIAVLMSKDQATQSYIEKTSVGCDALVLESFDQGIMVKPYVESIASQTEQINFGYPIDRGIDVESIGTQTSIAEPYVSIGVGICTIDDNCCIRCLSGEEFVTTKSVDEIMANQIDLPTYSSCGVGDMSLEDNYLCHRCCDIKVKETASGDLNIKDSYCCDHCSNLKTKHTASGDISIDDSYSCDRCANISTKTIACGDGMIKDLPCGPRASISTYSVRMNEDTLNKVPTDVKVPKFQNIGVGSCRSIDIGGDSISELHSDKCTLVKTRSIGFATVSSMRTVGVSNSCITDNFCDRCSNVRMKTIGVGECCLTDNFCDRCFHLQTKSIAVGDYDVNNIFTGKSIDNNDNFVGLSMHINGNANKTELQTFIANKNSSYEGTDSSELSEEGNSTLTYVSDTAVSDESSIDHDNPSSDSTGQMSEPSVSSSGHRSRVRYAMKSKTFYI
jgi:hypothetical protein